MRTFGAVVARRSRRAGCRSAAARRRRAVDRGFVLSDHADWPGLLAAIEATGAERVLVTHGYAAALVRYLREQGLDAGVIATWRRAIDGRSGRDDDGTTEATGA